MDNAYDDGAAPRSDAADARSSALEWGPSPSLLIGGALGTVAALTWAFVDLNAENRVVAGALAVAGALLVAVVLRLRRRLRVTHGADVDNPGTPGGQGPEVTGSDRIRSETDSSPVGAMTTPDGGLVVSGLWRTRYIPWARIQNIRAEQRGRFGRRGFILEIDVARAAGADQPADDELLTFGWFDLGTDPAAVARTLRRVRPSK